MTGCRFDGGTAVLASPRFPGTKDVRMLPLPAIGVHYGDRFSTKVREGIGISLLHNGVNEAGPVIGFVFPRDESDARAALKGLGHVAFTVEAGGFIRCNVEKFGSASAAVRKGVNGHVGLVVDGAPAADAPPLARNRLFLSARPRLSFYDQDYARAYYGTTPPQATWSDYAVFAPKNGYRASLGAGATYLVSPRIALSTFGSCGRLLGEIDRSRPVQGRFGARDKFGAARHRPIGLISVVERMVRFARTLDGFDRSALAANVAVALALVTTINLALFAFAAPSAGGGATVGRVPGWAIGIVWTLLFIGLATAKWRVQVFLPERSACLAVNAVVVLVVVCAAYPVYTSGLRLPSVGLAGNVATAVIALWTARRLARVDRAAVIAPLAVAAWVGFAGLLIVDELGWMR